VRASGADPSSYNTPEQEKGEPFENRSDNRPDKRVGASVMEGRESRTTHLMDMYLWKIENYLRI
jgi:hypothetical protein